MTTLLAQPSAGSLLGRRRESNTQYSPSMAPYMPTYNMSLKSPMAQHPAQIPMSHPHFIPIQTQPGSEMDAMMDINAFSQSNMVPNTMAFNNSTMALDTSYTNPYNLATTFNASMPVMPPQMESLPQWQTFDSMPMPHLNTHMRSESQSSLESCPPLIKSEDEQSPILPSQAFYSTPPYSMQADSSSPTGSDDSSNLTFSTDIDTLMKAIQSKGSNSSEPQQKVCLTSIG